MRLSIERTWLLIPLTLVACTTARAPEIAGPSVPASFGRAASQPAPGHLSQWWTVFGDPMLDRLIAEASAGNPDLLQAAARVRQARAQERIVRASALPLLDASAQAGYNRISENAVPNLPGSTPGGGPGGLIGLPGSDFALFQLGFDASWEADLFGGRQHEQAAAAARTRAAIWSAQDAQVMLAAEIGNAYLHYRTLQQRIAIADAGIAAERQLRDVTAARVRSGLAATPELRTRERAIAAAEANRASLSAERDARLHALSILTGREPMALAQPLASAEAMPMARLDIPPGLPSELLLRRPDLRAAERQLAAAASDTGAARADLFPKISLTGALQLVSTSLASLLTAGSIQASGAARLRHSLFDGGRRRATVDLRQAQAEEAVEAYRGQVLVALREVEDALSRIAADRARLEQLERSQAAARDAADTMQVRYRNGLIALSEVIEANKALLEEQDRLAEARGAAMQNAIALYKALGGGWQNGAANG